MYGFTVKPVVSTTSESLFPRSFLVTTLTPSSMSELDLCAVALPSHCFLTRAHTAVCFKLASSRFGLIQQCACLLHISRQRAIQQPACSYPDVGCFHSKVYTHILLSNLKPAGVVHVTVESDQIPRTTKCSSFASLFLQILLHMLFSSVQKPGSTFHTTNQS